MRKGELGAALLDLLACIIGFGGAAAIEYALTDSELLAVTQPWIPWTISTVIAWFAMVFPETQWHEGLRLWIDGFLAVAAMNLLIQSGLSYLFDVNPASWLVIVCGSAFTMAAAGLLHKWIPSRAADGRSGIIFAGPGHGPPARLIAAVNERILQPVLAGGSFPGTPDRLKEVCESQRPRRIVVSGRPRGAALATLLEMHYAGVEIEGQPFFYENLLQRVPWPDSRPVDLLFGLNPSTSRAMLAFQAIYKNLIGLALRLLAAPLMVLISLLIVLKSGAPAIEHIECLGYQRTPFRLLRFRIRDAGGNITGIGRVIDRLHLTKLPQLINVVRGEMGLFGPAPARTAIANRLIQLLPAYIYRFTVKPGIFGWYQANAADDGGLPEEITRLEYDLYYIKQESPSLDLDILLRMLSPEKSIQPAKAAGATGNS